MKRTIGLLVACMVMLAAGSTRASAEEALIDVVRLKDGTVLRGLVVEQNVGESLKLATVDRLVYTLGDHEVDRVEKQKTREPVPFYYCDVVLLRDGVLFRGVIVEQVPERSITLRTENELQLTFPVEEVWKIMKEKRVAEVPEAQAEERDREKREGLKIALQLELAKDRVRAREQGSEAEALEEQIDSLKEEVESLEQEAERAETALLEDRRLEERDRLEALQSDIDGLLDEVAGLLEKCETGAGAAAQPAAAFWSPAVPVLLQAALGRPVTQAAGGEEVVEQLGGSLQAIVQQTIQRLPTEQEVQALAARQRAYSSLTDLLDGKRWKRIWNRGLVTGMADELPAEDRVFLYETGRRRDAVAAMALNAIPVLNLGSWMQRDTWGIALGVMETFLSFGVAFAVVTDQWVGNAGDLNMLYVLGGTWALGLAEPYWFQYRWNSRLRRRLLLDQATIREVQRERAKAAVLGPPAVRLLPARDGGVAVQLNLMSLSY